VEKLANRSSIILKDARSLLSKLPLVTLALLVFGLGLALYVYELGLPALGFNWNNTDGVIFAVREGGPAEQAGLQRGDIFLRLEGVPLDARDEFRQAWKEIKSQKAAAITIERGGQEKSLTFAVETMPIFLEGYGIYYLVALVFWIAGVLVYLGRGQDKAATVYLVFCLAVAVASFHQHQRQRLFHTLGQRVAACQHRADGGALLTLFHRLPRGKAARSKVANPRPGYALSAWVGIGLSECLSVPLAAQRRV